MLCKIIIIFLLLLYPSYSMGLSEKYKTHFKKNIIFFSQAKTKYVWGGKGDLKEDVYQLDCSGFLYKAASMAGIPVKRSTAFNMAMGLDGWTSKKILLDDVDETDVVFWTWKTSPSRINGHVGALVVSPSSDLLEVCHASASKQRVIINQLKGVFLKDISCIRRLTLGDKKNGK